MERPRNFSRQHQSGNPLGQSACCDSAESQASGMQCMPVVLGMALMELPQRQTWIAVLAVSDVRNVHCACKILHERCMCIFLS